MADLFVALELKDVYSGSVFSRYSAGDTPRVRGPQGAGEGYPGHFLLRAALPGLHRSGSPPRQPGARIYPPPPLPSPGFNQLHFSNSHRFACGVPTQWTLRSHPFPPTLRNREALLAFFRLEKLGEVPSQHVAGLLGSDMQTR
jgi:hypothetical protein